MFILVRSSAFDEWLSGLADQKGKARILAHLTSAALGNFGDCEAVGEGVSEMRIHDGPGYRVYFVRHGAAIYLFAERRRQRDAEARYQAGEGNGARADGAGTMSNDFAAFDVSDYLDNDEVIADYLTAAAEDANPDVLLAALSEVAKARGMAQVAAAAGLGRESLYKALAPGSHPRFETVSAVLRALNVRISLSPAKTPVK